MAKREPQIGDVFAVRRADGEPILGRVVSTSAIVGPTHGCIIVYVYRDAPRARGERADLAQALLVPPILTTRGAWSRGYFAHLRSAPLLPGDYFERHVFRDAQGRLVDEEARPVAAAEQGEPVGEWRLFDVETIDAAIGAALARLPRDAGARDRSAAELAPVGDDYTLEDRPPTVDEYVRLRIDAGLSAKTLEAARIGLANTWFGVTVRLGGEAIAMGRLIGDGGLFFEVVDIAVHPAHQRRGLGKRVMTALMAYLEANAPPSAHVMLLADGPANMLYAQFGFRPTAPASIGMERRIDKA